MWFQATFTQPRVEGNRPALNGGWWSPFRRQVRIVSGLMSADTLVLPPATLRARYESDQLSDVVIWTQFNWYQKVMIKTRVGLTNSEAKASKKRLCIRAALHRIATQFPDCPEANLMFAIIDQAAVDLLNWGYREEAKRYLMYSGHAELCGVDPVWIRETFEKLGCFDDVSSKGPTCQ